MIIHGDSLDILKTLEANSVDAVVTDPPYGLAFMGKRWDYDVPKVDFWRETFRVLKPGAHVLSFGGTRTYHRMVVELEDAGFEIRDMLAWLYGQGFPKSHNLDGDWKGWGTALKPSHEPIVLARKPLEKGLTVAENVLKWGTGALAIDASRIALDESAKAMVGKAKQRTNANADLHHAYGKDNRKTLAQPIDTFKASGRWPANVLLDEEAAAILDEQSGISKSTGGGALAVFNNSKKNNDYGSGNRDFYTPKKNMGKGDVGGASRFFYVAKASKRERGVGNGHPTVKPIRLMEYLCKLITPPGGTILDPFAGSGSTGVAAVRLGYEFIGIEREKEYCEIAEKRIAHGRTS
jgi:site-specific DNA-methyltransferase (adenine-specific)